MNDPNLVDEIAALHAELCSALADPHRILILYILFERPYIVNDLAAMVGLSQPATSRHLKMLREAGLVCSNRQGVSVEYSLVDSRVIEALDILRALLHDRLIYKATLVENDKS
jgi:DNA-binding transcriptional ArsR family regulator